MAVPSELLIYDGDCGFCTHTANWYAGVSGDQARIASWQSLDLELFELTQDQASEAVQWWSQGSTKSGADACIAALLATKGPWKFLGRILSVAPIRWMARRIYPTIARNRHKLPGGTASCEWQPPKGA